MEVRVFGHGVLVELDDVRVADTQTGSIEVEVGFFLGGDADTHHGILLDEAGQVFEFVLVVQYGNDVLPAVLAKLGDILDVLGAFKTVADDVQVLFLHRAVALQGLDEVQVVGR